MEIIWLYRLLTVKAPELQTRWVLERPAPLAGDSRIWTSWLGAIAPAGPRQPQARTPAPEKVGSQYLPLLQSGGSRTLSDPDRGPRKAQQWRAFLGEA